MRHGNFKCVPEINHNEPFGSLTSSLWGSPANRKKLSVWSGVRFERLSLDSRPPSADVFLCHDTFLRQMKMRIFQNGWFLLEIYIYIWTWYKLIINALIIIYKDLLLFGMTISSYFQQALLPPWRSQVSPGMARWLTLKIPEAIWNFLR